MTTIIAYIQAIDGIAALGLILCMGGFYVALFKR